MKTRKINWRQILIVGLSMAIGVLCGMLIVEYTDSMAMEDDLMINPFVSGVLTFVGMVAGVYMLTIIHEAGHLVFGLLSGYTFKVEKDEKKVDKIKKQFEKCAKTYPYPGEIQSERELIGLLYTNNSKFSKE